MFQVIEANKNELMATCATKKEATAEAKRLTEESIKIGATHFGLPLEFRVEKVEPVVEEPAA